MEYREVTDETKELFELAISDLGLDHYIEFQIVDADLKKSIYEVKKMTPLNKYLSKTDIVLLINEEVFLQLESEHQKMVLDEALAPIHFDVEKEKIIISKPDFITFSGILSKHGYDEYKRMKEIVRLTILGLNERKEEMVS